MEAKGKEVRGAALLPVGEISLLGCECRFRRLQTCATGIEACRSFHHGFSVLVHAQCCKAQMDVGSQFALAQVANLRYRSRVASIVSSKFQLLQTCSMPRVKMSIPLPVRIAQVVNLRYRSIGLLLVTSVNLAGCKPALPEQRTNLGSSVKSCCVQCCRVSIVEIPRNRYPSALWYVCVIDASDSATPESTSTWRWRRMRSLSGASGSASAW